MLRLREEVQGSSLERAYECVPWWPFRRCHEEEEQEPEQESEPKPEPKEPEQELQQAE